MNEIIVMGTTEEVGIPSAEFLAKELILWDHQSWGLAEVSLALRHDAKYCNLTREELDELAEEVYHKIREAKVIVKWSR